VSTRQGRDYQEVAAVATAIAAVAAASEADAKADAGADARADAKADAEAYAEAPPQVEPVLQERNVVPDQGFHPGFACDHSVACASTCAAGHD
jgi:hypothetical protein